jgi:hypothetical protein
MIKVRHLEGDDYEVKVSVAGADAMTYQVSLEETYYRRLASGKVSPEQLIEESFKFLLEREPAGSILRKFELPIIGEYFPEYEDVVGWHLRASS